MDDDEPRGFCGPDGAPSAVVDNERAACTCNNPKGFTVVASGEDYL